MTEGRIVALQGEAGFQAELLRGGLHAGFFPWQYRIHKEPLVMIAESKIGYIYARDGSPLPPTQTLARIVDCNHFQDAQTFLERWGQRGRQRAILREGVFAINSALFVVITEDRVFAGPIREKEGKYSDWQEQSKSDPWIRPRRCRLRRCAAAKVEEPVVGGADLTIAPTDTIGIVTIHDGGAATSASPSARDSVRSPSPSSAPEQCSPRSSCRTSRARRCSPPDRTAGSGSARGRSSVVDGLVELDGVVAGMSRDGHIAAVGQLEEDGERKVVRSPELRRWEDLTSSGGAPAARRQLERRLVLRAIGGRRAGSLEDSPSFSSLTGIRNRIRAGPEPCCVTPT